tara:strand:+ start:235 stop:396 length:162 start_codon:yes stop_codon:yes gene_type:complete
MVTILLVAVTGEVLNPRLTSKITMLTDISHIVHGEQVVMDLNMVTEVLEDVKE